MYEHRVFSYVTLWVCAHCMRTLFALPIHTLHFILWHLQHAQNGIQNFFCEHMNSKIFLSLHLRPLMHTQILCEAVKHTPKPKFYLMHKMQNTSTLHKTFYILLPHRFYQPKQRLGNSARSAANFELLLAHQAKRFATFYNRSV